LFELEGRVLKSPVASFRFVKKRFGQAKRDLGNSLFKTDTVFQNISKERGLLDDWWSDN